MISGKVGLLSREVEEGILMPQQGPLSPSLQQVGM